MNLRPLHDRIIVKRLDQERQTASGIVIPDQLPKSRIKARFSPSATARFSKTANCARWT